jgi:hypothetical protein
LQALQAQLGDARAQIGTLEGSLAALHCINAGTEKTRHVQQRTSAKSALGRITGPIGRQRPPTHALGKSRTREQAV